jgi:hypothetical protein
MKQCWNMGFQNPVSKDSWLITHKPIETWSWLFMVQRTLLSWWLIRSALIYSIRLNHSINTQNNWLNMNHKMNIRLFATSTKMPHPLGMLTIIMLYFIVGGFHLGLLLRQVSTSLAIGLIFGIFVLDNAKVSRSMWVLLLWTSYDFLCIQNYKMSIFTQVPCVVYLLFHCNISYFFDVFIFLLCKSLMMRSGWTCPLVI